ncbi:SDR family NAD(P)-dependent oxidoreductase [Streptomyces sp. M10(2022)]
MIEELGGRVEQSAAGEGGGLRSGDHDTHHTVDGVIRTGTVTRVTTSSETQKLIVVTGASTGMGASVARQLARQGFHVLAGVRRDRDADAIRSTGIEPVILDITKSEQVAALAARIADDPRALHALVNNAGVQVNAPVEALPMAQWRQVFEVNLFGHIAVTQALLPALLHSGAV